MLLEERWYATENQKNPIQGGVGDMPKSPSSQYGLKAQEDIYPRGIRVTDGPMR
jgi:hypothetical protein